MNEGNDKDSPHTHTYSGVLTLTQGYVSENELDTLVASYGEQAFIKAIALYEKRKKENGKAQNARQKTPIFLEKETKINPEEIQIPNMSGVEEVTNQEDNTSLYLEESLTLIATYGNDGANRRANEIKTKREQEIKEGPKRKKESKLEKATRTGHINHKLSPNQKEEFEILYGKENIGKDGKVIGTYLLTLEHGSPMLPENPYHVDYTELSPPDINLIKTRIIKQWGDPDANGDEGGEKNYKKPKKTVLTTHDLQEQEPEQLFKTLDRIIQGDLSVIQVHNKE